MEPTARLISASRAKTNPAMGAVPKVVNRLSWLACSSLSAGTRFGTVASLAGVQNSEAQDARNCTVYAQVSSFTRWSLRFSGMDRYSKARTTSPTIMVMRRSKRSATAPASGPRISAGSSETSQTPRPAALCATAALCGVRPCPARSYASAVIASRLSQSPRLERDNAIHSRRKGLMESTPARPLRKGDVKFTALGYPQIGLRSQHQSGSTPRPPGTLPACRRYYPFFVPAPLDLWPERDGPERRDRADPDRPAADDPPDRARDPLADRRGDGAAARRSASSSTARRSVTSSPPSPLRSDAFVSPSVTYSPNRPSRSTIGLPLAGSAPISRSGAAAAALVARPRGFGWANSSLASSSVTVNICSSGSRDRLSVPLLAEGP